MNAILLRPGLPEHPGVVDAGPVVGTVWVLGLCRGDIAEMSPFCLKKAKNRLTMKLKPAYEMQYIICTIYTQYLGLFFAQVFAAPIIICIVMVIPASHYWDWRL